MLAVYEKEYYAGSPAVAKNSFGKGTAYYLAAEFEQRFYCDFYQKCMEEMGIHNPLNAKLPYGVTVSERKGERDMIFLQNFRSERVKAEAEGKYRETDTGAVWEGMIELEAFECKLLEKANC